MIETPKRNYRKINDAEWIGHGLIKHADDKPEILEYTPLGFYVIEILGDELDNRDEEWREAIEYAERRLEKRKKMTDERHSDVLNNKGKRGAECGNEKGREQRKFVLSALIGGLVGTLFYYLIEFLFFGI